MKIKATMTVCFASTVWMGTEKLKTLDIRDEDNGIQLLNMHSNFEKSFFFQIHQSKNCMHPKLHQNLCVCLSEHTQTCS